MSDRVDSLTAELSSLGLLETDAAAIAVTAAQRGLDREAALALGRARLAGAPLGQLVGAQRFLGVELLTARDALVPRAETEILGRAALDLLPAITASSVPRVIDMCCGSGNLACAIAAALPSASVLAADLTDGAVTLARRNVEHLGLGARVAVHQGDLFLALSGLAIEGTIDMIICNPPYISSQRLAKDRAGLVDHEPREAFDGGPYGLSIHQRVINEAHRFLRPGGALLLEFGLGQERQVQRLFERAASYDELRFVGDAVGAPRVCVGRKRM